MTLRPLAPVAFLLVSILVTDVGAMPTDTQKCQALKLAASGRYVHCRIAAEASFAKTSDAAKRAERLAACADRFAGSLSKADDNFGAACPPSPPVAALDSFLAQCTDTTASSTGGGPLPPYCGDGAINACGEVCDGADLGGATCYTQGFVGGGPLACSPGCELDTSACSATRTVGCCQISVGALGISACTDVSLVPNDDCAQANTLLASFPLSGNSATLAAPGLVCNGATGFCEAVRTGAGTCCSLDSYNTCGETLDTDRLELRHHRDAEHCHWLPHPHHAVRRIPVRPERRQHRLLVRAVKTASGVKKPPATGAGEHHAERQIGRDRLHERRPREP